MQLPRTTAGPLDVIIAPTRGSNGVSNFVVNSLQVIIAPTRGSNMNISGDAPPAPPGHHRPYEGQQRGRERGGDRHDDGHHRPYEGQQHFRRRRQAACDPDPSSSPLRGAATPGRSWIPRLDCQVIIAPTRGSDKVSGSGHPTGAGSHHRPYEGQQRESLGRRHRGVRQVIIAPTRGSNLIDDAERETRRKVIIAPTRGSNQMTSLLMDAKDIESSSPLRGAATRRPGSG